ncbi:phage tail tip lysozyme [Nocardia brasiliensis]|uniref:phage tail tip lysozyme n=1 Tax=Nocardia brasiliensis TaxID=37326 RepID=UPI003D8E8463
MCQWRDEDPGSGRLSNLEAFAAHRPGGIGDWRVQVDFIIEELNSTESAARGPFMAAATPGAAAMAFDRHYERSSGRTTEQRMTLAENIAASMVPAVV